MVKGLIYLGLVCFSSLSLSAFEKLPLQYQVCYGNADAPIKIVEYISLSCQKCLEGWQDFKHFKDKYINTQKVYWVFHINPADLPTLQAMVCLEKLSPANKRIFWEALLDTLDDPSESTLIMQIAMETLGSPQPQLEDLSYLKNTDSFKNALQYLKQTDVIKEIPTVEINGKIYDDFPSRKFLGKQFDSLLMNRS